MIGADLVDPSADFARKLCLAKVAASLPFEIAEARFGSGDIDGLMEDVVSAVEAVAAESDVVVVEGLDPGIGGGMSDTLNSAMCRSLDAQRLIVLPGQGQDENALAASISKIARSYAGERAPAGVLINKHDRVFPLKRLWRVCAMRDGHHCLLLALSAGTAPSCSASFRYCAGSRLRSRACGISGNLAGS